MKKGLVPFVLAFLLLTGCNKPVTAEPIHTPETSQELSGNPAKTMLPIPSGDRPVTATAEPVHSPDAVQQLPESPVKTALPLPTAEMYGLTGVEALLFNAAVANYCMRGLVTDLILPSLSILDSYETDSGDTCYVCWFEEHDYYGLGLGWEIAENPKYTYSTSGRYVARFTISKDGDGLPVCTEMMRSLNGDNLVWEKSIFTICGPNTALASAITSFEKPAAQPRYLTPSDPEKLLRIYLDYCFNNPREGSLCVKLPLPSSRVYGLSGVDAALYDAAVECYSTKTIKYGICDALLLPSLAVLDTYPAENGSTCYVCMFRQYDYYQLGYGLANLDNPQYSSGGGSNIARFTVCIGEGEEPICTEVFEGYEGSGWAKGIRLICGPNTALAEAVIKNTKRPVTARDITTPSIAQLLSVYIDYYFR